MAVTLQFVDSIATSPAIRLDLNTSPWSLQAEGTDFGFPELQRAVVSTLLADGGSVPASAYGLRTLTLRLLVSGTDANAVATQMQSLFRELERAKNILKYQPHTSSPVFFKTLRSGPESAQIITSGANQLVSVQILAEPFALGLKETPLSAVTVNTWDPTATNGLFADLTGIKGDVEAPVTMRFPGTSSTGVVGNQYLFAVRRRGTPSNWPLFLQAEAMTKPLNSETTNQVNDAVMSGTGNNYTRTAFGDTLDRERLEMATWPTGSSVDYRGTYRVFGRFRRTDTTGVISVRLQGNKQVQIGTGTALQLVDLGLWALPGASDPLDDGGVEYPVSGASAAFTGGMSVRLYAQRASGTSNLDTDLLAFVPADDRFMLVNAWVGNSTDTAAINERGVIFSPHDGQGLKKGGGSPNWIGGLPMLTPGQTNRLYMARVGSLLASPEPTPTVTVEYRPRYLMVRPPSS